MTRAEYDALHDSIAAALRERGIAFRRLRDEGYRLDVHGVECDMGLASLAHRFHDAPEDARVEVVRGFVASAVELDPRDVEALIRDWRWARSRLRVLIAPESRVKLTPGVVATPVHDELFRTLVVDLPDRLAGVQRELTASWPSSDEAWFDVAWDQTLAAAGADEVTTRGAFETVMGDDYVTSRVSYAASTSVEPHGVIVALPCRGICMRHVLTTKQAWADAYATMGRASFDMFKRHERPISPALWWYQPGVGVWRLAVDPHGDDVRIGMPQELLDLLP